MSEQHDDPMRLWVGSWMPEGMERRDPRRTPRLEHDGKARVREQQSPAAEETAKR